ncbi:type III-B CRISPR-associated protein Cas10/Cmr2 [Brachymonas denitrificans]|uniref:type III-B CRISPR-associated protein Cas10/Cmr2 n=1 Tax=Brachymonas denitrificans TaxID=28220 RepID=UPI00321FADC2
MTQDNTSLLWQTKVAGRLHDPAEKALVLLRDPAGHENGTSRALSRLLGLHELTADTVDADGDDALAHTLFPDGIQKTMYRHVQHADWWAAAADRPQWPMETISVQTAKGEKSLRIAPWAQVRWTSKPELKHPLTGECYDMGKHGGLSDTDFGDIKDRSFDHHTALLSALHKQGDEQHDWRKILLTLWRFAPELSEENDNGRLGALWKLLPADTRIPEHSIWDHLDLTSAFAGGFAADPDGQVALLTIALGPVQPFIAASRKMEDLWAGSHLLARLSWEAMRVVCEQFGPDAVLFPRLRGVPQVDLWLREQGVPSTLFQNCDWNRGSTDSNPLFAAALPNRFVAVVPASAAATLATAIETHVRDWLQQLGQKTLERLLDAAGLEVHPDQYCHQQMREQLAGFPEFHWAAVPFSLIGVSSKERQTGLDTTQLSAAMQPFFGTAKGQACGFLNTEAWKLLQEELTLSESSGKTSTFFAPNPGVLYPAVHDLAERALAATKALRTFKQAPQHGWRCTLSGESEWLTIDAAELRIPAAQRKDTMWNRIARKNSAWVKDGEYLGALSAIKRLWPSLFAREISQALGKDIGRFVVSTHTMALAQQLDNWLQQGGMKASGLDDLQRRYQSSLGAVALPRGIVRKHQSVNPAALRDASQLPALLDLAYELESEQEASQIRQVVQQTIANAAGNSRKLEAYYSLLLMDGDRMGAWLAGGDGTADDSYAISYRDSFHSQVQRGFDEHAARQPRIQAYGAQKRALSPSRHLAISGALNDFSLTVVRHVVEQEHLGRLIYAGGDDVFAMLPVADVLSAMQRLRHAYSGTDPEHEGGRDPRGLTLSKGFAYLNGQLMRMMGSRATASCGAVIAHHEAPLAAVRRELAAAEQRAKNEGGRDAFSITVIKRSGGALRLTAKWGEPMHVLCKLRDFFQDDNVSRRAAYNTLEWLNAQELPVPEGDGAMLNSLLGYQLDRQASGEIRHQAPELARRLTALTLQKNAAQRIDWLRNFISVAEFLAREVRSNGAGDEA